MAHCRRYGIHAFLSWRKAMASEFPAFQINIGLLKPNFDHFLTEPAEKTSYSLSRRSCNLSILVDRCFAP